jgi:hypothetical protein
MLSGEQIHANGACVSHPLLDPQNDWLPEIPIASPTPDLRLDISSPKHSATLHDPSSFSGPDRVAASPLQDVGEAAP